MNRENSALSDGVGPAVAGHTPGPWVASQSDNRVWAHEGQMPVCEIRGWGFLTGTGGLRLLLEDAAAIQDANARLIAASPDLLAALRCLTALASGLQLDGADVTVAADLLEATIQAEDAITRATTPSTEV